MIKKIFEKIEFIREWWYIKKGRIYAKYLRVLFAECGSNFKVNGRPYISEPGKISVGNNVTINNACQICPRGKVYLSDYVVMSRGAQITAGSLDTNNWINEKYKERKHMQGDVFIGEGTWLCINSIILPGVSITGKGVIVAAGAVVTHDITEYYVVVGGAPARIVKRLKVESNENI